MWRKPIALLLVLASVTAACGGGDNDDDKAGGAGATDTSVASGDTTTTSTAGGGGPLGAGAPSGSGGTPSASSPATTVAGGTTSTTVRPTAVTRTAAPGRYIYRRTGTRTVGTDQSLDGEGTLVVDRPNGNEQHSKVEYTESVSEQTLRHRPGGIDLVHLRSEIRGFSNYEFRPSPPVLFAPDPAAVGATWSWRMTSTDGGLTIDASFRVARTETVTIGGEAVATAVVEGDLRFSGALTGTSKQTVWGSDKYRLVVRTEETTDVGIARSRFNSVLTSTKPA